MARKRSRYPKMGGFDDNHSELGYPADIEAIEKGIDTGREVLEITSDEGAYLFSPFQNTLNCMQL